MACSLKVITQGAEVRDGHFVWCPLWMYSALITGLSSGPSPLINERREMRAFSVCYHLLRRLPLLNQDCMRVIRFPKVTHMVPSENIWVWKGKKKYMVRSWDKTLSDIYLNLVEILSSNKWWNSGHSIWLQMCVWYHAGLMYSGLLL